jgi:hypothetical protein
MLPVLPASVAGNGHDNGHGSSALATTGHEHGGAGGTHAHAK